MAKTYNVLTIDIKEDVFDIITAKQDDTMSRYLDVRLQDGGQPINLTGNEVKIYGRKADGKAFFNNGQITNATSGRCQFELTNQALAVAGIVKLEISIWQNNERILTTPTFGVHVLPKIRNDDAIESSNEFGALVVLYQKLYDFWMDVENVLGTTTDTGGSATEGSVMAKLNAILTSGSASGGLKIKSIQHGLVDNFETLTPTTAPETKIKINAVNIANSILITDTGSYDYRSSSSAFYAVDCVPYLYDSTTIRRVGWGNTSNGYRYPNFNWSVIEFY